MTGLKKLKKEGYKITSPRKEILSVLSPFPATVQEIAVELEKRKIQTDRVSVYRTLELFVKLGLVEEVEFGDGKKRYELVNNNNHHHHLVCNKCGKVEDIKLSIEDKMLKDIKNQSGFKIERHSLELFGLCTNCQ